jgi:HIRAN domain
MQFVLAGAFYRAPTARKFVENLSDREACEFVPEPTNKMDPNAIKVVCQGHHIGYVPSSLTGRIKDKKSGVVVPADSDYDLLRPIVYVN